MGIHHKVDIPTKTQQKELFSNCAKNGTKKCLEYTDQDTYGSTDTRILPRL